LEEEAESEEAGQSENSKTNMGIPISILGSTTTYY
jgi:hypothetical protein